MDARDAMAAAAAHAAAEGTSGSMRWSTVTWNGDACRRGASIAVEPRGTETDARRDGGSHGGGTPPRGATPVAAALVGRGGEEAPDGATSARMTTPASRVMSPLRSASAACAAAAAVTVWRAGSGLGLGDRPPAGSEVVASRLRPAALPPRRVSAGRSSDSPWRRLLRLWADAVRRERSEALPRVDGTAPAVPPRVVRESVRVRREGVLDAPAALPPLRDADADALREPRARRRPPVRPSEDDPPSDMALRVSQRRESLGTCAPRADPVAPA